MEPFGILNLLKPLLDLAPSQTNEKKVAEENFSTQETEKKEETVAENATLSNAQTAILDFMNAHDARAKRFRK